MDIFDLLGVAKIKKNFDDAQKNAAQGAYTPQEVGASALGPLGLLLAGSQRQKEIAQGGLEAASYAVPMGKGANLVSKFLLPGAVSGGLRSLSADNPTAQSVAGGAAGGAVGAGVTGGLFDILGKAGNTLTNKVPQDLMNQIFKEAPKATKTAVVGGETLGKMALKRGVKGVSDEAILQGAQGKMTALEDSLQTALQNSDATVGVDELTKTVKPLLQKYAAAGNTADVNAITSRIEALKAFHGDQIPVSAANEVKRTLYEEIGNKFGSQSSEGIEGLKAIARGLKESIASKVSGVDKINEELGFNGRVRDAMVSKIATATRSSGLGLKDTVLAAGGLAGAAGSGGLSLLPFLGSLAGSTGGKTTLANTLSQAGQSIGNSALPGVLGQIFGTGGAQAGAGVSQLMSGPKSPDANYNDSNNSNQTHSDQIIPQGQPKPLKDGDLSPGGEWKFNAKKGDWEPVQGQQSPSTGGSGITKEQLGQIMLQDLLNGGKNIDKLDKISKYLVPEDGKAKALTLEQQKAVSNVNSANRALDTVDELLKKNPNLPLLAKSGPLKGIVGASTYDTAQKEVADVLGRLRTGAVINDEEMKNYLDKLPQPGDKPEDIAYKMKQLRGLFAELKDRINTQSIGGTTTVQQ